MKSNTKLSSKKKSSKATAGVNDSGQNMQAVQSERAKPKQESKNKPDENQPNIMVAPDNDIYDMPDVESRNELYTLRYDINERGIGKILLPPSLSTLLQSDRVAISPAAGGLFIRSL